MKRILPLLLVARAAWGHYVPGERVVVAQAEPHRIALLVTFHPDAGLLGELLGVDAKAKGTIDFLKAIYTARALAPVHVTLDGKALAWARLDAKLTEDPPGTGRAAVVLLLDGAIPDGEHRVEVRVDPAPEPTQTEWIDRSDGAVKGPPAQQLIDGSATLILGWRQETTKKF